MPSQELRNKATGKLGRFFLIRGEQRFIANEDDPTAGVGALEAGLIAAGRSTVEIPERFMAALGSEQAQQRISRSDALFAALEAEHPVATGLGAALPGFAVPGGKVVQIGVGIVEGALAIPQAPFTGAAKGAAFGLVGQRIGDEIGGLVTRKLQSMSSKVSRRAQAEAARTVRSIDRGLLSGPLTVGERTGSRVARSVERAAETAAGAPIKAGRRQANLNRQFDLALGGKGDVDQLTGDILGGHSARISNVFESAAKGVDEIPITQAFSDNLGALRQSANELLPNSRALKQLDFIEDLTLGDKMTGQQYLRLRTRLGKISRNEWSPGGDAISGEFVDDMITVLDDMFAESAPALAAKLTKARSEWRVLIAVRKGAALDPSGNVNPNAMQTALENVFPGVDRARFSEGATGLAQRANVASQRFGVEPSSRTAERLTSFNPLMQAKAALLNVGGGTGGLVGGGVAREAGIAATADELIEPVAP